MRRAIATMVLAIWAYPGLAWAQAAEPADAGSRRAPLSRARILTGAGLLIGGTVMVAAAQDSLYPDDRRLLLFQGFGSLTAGGLTLVLPSRVSDEPAAQVLPPDQEGPSRRKLWTGVGLAAGGAMFLAQSVLLFQNGCGQYNDECRGMQFAFRFIGGTLTGVGVSLIVLDQVEKRRGTRVALGIAPRAVRLEVSF
jgi:hypothetical protein